MVSGNEWNLNVVLEDRRCRGEKVENLDV